MVILTPDYMYMTASYPSAHKHTWLMVLPIDEYTYMGPPRCPWEIPII